MDRLKLKWKLFAFLLGFCALLLLILWLFQTVLLQDTYKLIRTREMKQAITLVEREIDNPKLQTILEELKQDKEILVTPSGSFVAPPLPPRRGEEGRKPAETLTEEKVFTKSDGTEAALTFYAMITPVDATVSTLKLQLGLITGLMLVLSVILALIIARRIARPIAQMNEGAKKLALGNYEADFHGHGFLEIAELSATMNTAANELSKVENLRRELMGNISHDLRTPLSLIYSYAEMMHDFPDEVTPEQTALIMEETNRLTSLVNDILDISRLETGNLPLSLSDYDLTASLQSTVNRVLGLVKKDGYRLELLREESRELSLVKPLIICADEVKITQAFYNLLLNAITHTGEDKLVTVTVQSAGEPVRILVTDSGEGIDPDDLPYIWDRYYKVDKIHSRPVTGTGLGLSIVKKIVEAHGGSCGVLSESGRGSTFWIELGRKE